MKKEQLSEHIGNIDDQLVQQAEHIPNYARQHRQKGFKRFTAFAAVIALMVCSFTVGAVAFAKEIVVEVPVEQETIELKEIGLTLILPDSWKGKYALEYDADFKEYYVYNPAIRKAMGGDSETLSSGGMLFYVKVWEEQLTKEQVEAGGEWSFAKCEYITTTQNGTYLLYYASDEQFTPDTMDEYRQMESEISDIQFVVGNVTE